MRAMAQTLTQGEIPSTLHAAEYFGRDKGMLVATPAADCSLPYIIVPEGFYAIVTTSGAEQLHDGSPIWPAGFYWVNPLFTQVQFLVTKQYVVFDAPVKGCKTSDNVTVQINVSVLFRIRGDADRNEDPEARVFARGAAPIVGVVTRSRAARLATLPPPPRTRSCASSCTR